MSGDIFDVDEKTLQDGIKKQSETSISMGGQANIHLLYNCVRLMKPKYVIETGVAYGWSSLAILKALYEIGYGNLISVDMPYPLKNNENYVGIVIPNYLKTKWKLIRKPDRPGIIEALNIANGKIDICHYDSDKSWWGRKICISNFMEFIKIKRLIYLR